MKKLNKIVIWGLEPNSHTHSYIHGAFFKAFKHMGYDVYWFKDEPVKTNFDFSCSFFITINIANEHIPILNDCFYVCHNCDTGSAESKYLLAKQEKRCFSINVFTLNMHTKGFITTNPFIYGIENEPTLIMHWMTDLLPHEIQQNIDNFIDYKQRIQRAIFIGSINNCPQFGNESELKDFRKECKNNNIPFIFDGLYASKCVGINESYDLIKQSCFAPSIVGWWQKSVGYIPCRIFKNISYGHISGTNSKTVSDVFRGKIPYNEHTGSLFHEMKQSITDTDATKNTIELMEIVRDNFTYVHLIDHIFNFVSFHNPEFHVIKK